MKNAFSYLFPLVKKFFSRYSGTVEVTWLNGKKVVNSKNANYSYGALQEILDYGLARTQADRSAEVLVLGLGGGSVVGLLRKKYSYYGKITAVEIDPTLIEIAENEFGIRVNEPLELICDDALEYVKNAEGQFGLIVIDIFIDLEIPLQVFASEFWKDISRLTEVDGKIIFNAGIFSANQPEIAQLLKVLEGIINFRKIDDVHGTNTLLLGTKM